MAARRRINNAFNSTRYPIFVKKKREKVIAEIIQTAPAENLGLIESIVHLKKVQYEISKNRCVPITETTNMIDNFSLIRLSSSIGTKKPTEKNVKQAQPRNTINGTPNKPG